MNTTKAVRAARKDAHNYLAACYFEGQEPSNDVAAFGGWDGWAIEGDGLESFAKSIMRNPSLSLLERLGSGERPEEFQMACESYHTEFSRVVEDSLQSAE